MSFGAAAEVGFSCQSAGRRGAALSKGRGVISGEVLIVGASCRRYRGTMEHHIMNSLLTLLTTPDQAEVDAPTRKSIWHQSILDEVREVTWLSFIVTVLSIASVGLGIALALTLEG
jgi:hypothetical protein